MRVHRCKHLLYTQNLRRQKLDCRVFCLCTVVVCVILSLRFFMSYAFILGRTPDLSLAELGAFFGEKMEVLKNKTAVIVEAPLPSGFANAQAFLNRLGGTTEIVEVVQRGVLVRDLDAALETILKKQCGLRDSKCNFALSLVPEVKGSKMLRYLLPKLKKNLRAADISANFMNKNFENVSQVLAVKQHLVSRGTNISMIDEGEGKVTIGYSVALQDFESYSKRDYDKPFRDANVGMLPPKLAQMMINMARPEGAPLSVIDPFCGTGTILIEALLMGAAARGADKDARMATGAAKNIAWLREHFKIPQETISQIATASATSLKPSDIGASVSGASSLVVVTEPYLGAPLTTYPSDPFLEKMKQELSTLYLGFFKNLATWIPKGTPIVFLMPAWNKTKTERTRLSVGLIDKIEALGYSISAFEPSKATSLFYDRPGQIVAREILRFVKR